MTTLPQPLNKREAATAMRCSPRTVQRRVSAGQLQSIRDGANRLLFLPEFIEKYFADRTVGAAPTPAKPKRNPKYR